MVIVKTSEDYDDGNVDKIKFARYIRMDRVVNDCSVYPYVWQIDKKVNDDKKNKGR